MVYMALLGILAIAAVPQIGNYRLHQAVVTMQSDARAFANVADAQYTISYAYPASTDTTTNPNFLKGAQASSGDVVKFVNTNSGTSYRIIVTNPTKAPTKTVVYDSTLNGLQPVATTSN
ncbi:hypothetical protein GCM10025867_47280 (plasmid) [Frondihabitans sucicola]|uniref:Uncharacterized protein n=2 Tax=Frondihabitans sucicola TaxID=1268041 RepID=A0ABN6Y8J4_9MICO|nr:hypothetical protein GCM10025867_47280 [Frondihabitans sucicola]